jgi:hypothetical protein
MVIEATRRERQRPLRRGRLVLGAVAALALAASPVAAADPPPVSTTATASTASTKEQVLTLYNQGKELLDAGKTAEACQAFESAKRLDFTAFNLILRLGDCYERLGKTASAYSQYQQAASVAAAAKDARQITAEERIAAVEPLLARLAVNLAPGAAGVVVRRNGEVLGGEKLDGKSAPVDPGSYTFEAAATGKKTWSTTRVIAPGASVIIDVPALETIVIAAPRAAALSSPEAPSSARRTIGLALGGVGLVGLGVGAAFGVKALANLAASKADGHCDAESYCDDEGFQLRHDARDAGMISTVTLALGATAAVAGAILWLTAPAGPRAPARARASSSTPRFPLTHVTAGAVSDAHSGSVWLRGAF